MSGFIHGILSSFKPAGAGWVQRGSVLTASDAAVSDLFGTGVALSSDGLVLAVGAYNWENTGTNRGGVYIFDWNGSSWVQRGSVLTASDAADNDSFGASVALSSNGAMLAVGATDWEGATSNQGGVYIFDWNGSSWVQRGSVLTAGDAGTTDLFGYSVSLSSNGLVLAVGSLLWEGGSSDQGGVYIYDISGSTYTQRGSVLVSTDVGASDYFGCSVSLSGDGEVLAVGAYNWEGGLTDQGSVSIFDRSGTAWVIRGSILTAGNAVASDNFGRSVALSDSANVLAVGAVGRDAPSSNQGGVYIYDISGSTYTQRGAMLTASDYAAGDQFGYSVALSGSGGILAAGAPYWEGGSSDQGGVYIIDYT